MNIFGKKMIKGITVACGVSLVAAALSGCNLLGSNKPSNNVQNLNRPSETVTVTEPETKPENIEPEDGWTKPESTDTQTVDAASSGVKASMVNFEKITNPDGPKEKAVITGYDVEGNELWVYETEEDYMTELDRVSDIITTNDEYIFVAFGDVIALDLETGKEKWVNHDFKGASPSWSMNYEGDTLFLCGYYGPALFVMDFNGNTINRIQCEDEEYFWPYQIIFVNDNQVDVLFESNGQTKSFDPYGSDVQ